MPERDPLSTHYDGVTHAILMRAIRASRSRRGVLAWVASPRGEYRATDRGGRTRHERAFTRSAYYLTWRVYLNRGEVPPWSLKLTWGDDLRPSSQGKMARPVTVRMFPRSAANRPRKAGWSEGGFQSTVGDRIDD